MHSLVALMIKIPSVYLHLRALGLVLQLNIKAFNKFEKCTRRVNIRKFR